MMYEKLKILYCEGKLTDAGLEKAVERGWISGEQAENIRSQIAKLEENVDG